MQETGRFDEKTGRQGALYFSDRKSLFGCRGSWPVNSILKQRFHVGSSSGMPRRGQVLGLWQRGQTHLNSSPLRTRNTHCTRLFCWGAHASLVFGLASRRTDCRRDAENHTRDGYAPRKAVVRTPILMRLPCFGSSDVPCRRGCHALSHANRPLPRIAMARQVSAASNGCDHSLNVIPAF